jgi:hypothetical protein
MPTIRASSTAMIEAPPQVVYGIIADYRNGHPRILPRKYFGELVVEEGGVGAGTLIRFEMRSFGGLQTFRARVTEPEPGRRLVETVVDPEIVTTFTVDPGPSGAGDSRVTIDTRYERGGLRGWIERLLAPAFLRTVYRAELAMLVAAARAAAGEQRSRQSGRKP